MTHNEFIGWLNEECEKHVILRHAPPFTVNELVWLLRMQPDDYNLSMKKKNGSWSCVPSVKECFIPARDLACKMEIEQYDEDEVDGKIYKCLQLKLL